MVKVTVWGSLQNATENLAEVEVEAKNIRELLARLTEQYPGLKPQIDRGVSVSIDGQIYSKSLIAEIKPGSEVVLLPRLAGG
jgi:molybdopterin converting factor small subunit